jgi:spore coat protein H
MSPAALLLLAGCSVGTVEGVDALDPQDSGDVGGGDTDTDTDDPGAGALACGLDVDLETPYYWEGETVSVEISCSSGLTPEEAGVQIVGLPDAAVFGSSSGLVQWETGPRDGGRVDLTVTVPTPSSGPPESEVVTFWVADNPDIAGAREPDPMTYAEEWGLPVVHLEVGRPMSESEQAATITVRGQQVEGAAKIRGAFSASYTKPSYTLDFDSAELGVAEWGDKTRGHMVLITAFDDISYVRQKLVYDLWEEMADFHDAERLTPRTFFTIVYLDGEYQGLYTGCDRIDDEFVRHMGFEDGEGNLYKAVSHDANFKLERSNGAAKTWLASGYEKAEGLPEDDFSDLEALVAGVGAASDAELATGAYPIQLDEFMDWFLLVTYTLAEDSAGKNSYLYVGPDSEDFRFIPWDFNHSWGQDWRTLREDPDTDNEYRWNNRVFIALQDDPTLRAQLDARAEALHSDGPLNAEWVQEQLDDYYETLGPNPARDWEHWESAHRRFDGWRSLRDDANDWEDHEGEVAFLREWIDDRDDWFGRWLR